MPSRAQRQAPLCRKETQASGSVLACPPAHHPQRQEAALTQQFPYSRATHTLMGMHFISPGRPQGQKLPEV